MYWMPYATIGWIAGRSRKLNLLNAPSTQNPIKSTAVSKVVMAVQEAVIAADCKS